jgi:hypothetical protein
MDLSRRSMLVAAGSALAAPQAMAQPDPQQSPEGLHAMPVPEQMQVVQRGSLYSNLHDPNITQLPPNAFEQRFTFSPAPKANPSGIWSDAAPLSIPRSEMAWTATEDNRMHVVGGYAEQQVARAYHHVFDARTGQWRQAAPIPAHNRPPCALMIERLIDRPMPKPPGLVV